jgi:hypothetical protein
VIPWGALQPPRAPSLPANLRFAAGVLLGVVLPLAIAGYFIWHAQDRARDAYTSEIRRASDFRYFYNAGRAMWADPPVLYVPPENYRQWAIEHGYGAPGGFAYGAALPIAYSPLLLIDMEHAFTVWKGAVFVATLLLAALVASSFQSWGWRIAAFTLVMLWRPLLLNALIGQTGAFIAVIACVGFLLYLKNRGRGAAVLALLVVKPTALIGPALAIWSERKAPIRPFLITAAAVALLPFLWLGPLAFIGWIDIILERTAGSLGSAHGYDQGLTRYFTLSAGPGWIVLGTLMFGLVGSVLLTAERQGTEAAAAIAMAGALLINPHSMIYDWGIALVIVLLLARSSAFASIPRDVLAAALLLTLIASGEISFSRTAPQLPVAVTLPTLWAGGVFLLLLTRTAYLSARLWLSRPRATEQATAMEAP